MLLYGQSVNAFDVAAFSLALFFLATFIRRYLALRHIPGPLLASLTDFWFFWVMRHGDYTKKALELDRKYGKLVRYGPNRVLFSDATAIPLVYGTTKAFDKAESYDVLTPYINGKLVPSLLSSRDETAVSAIKRHISHVFSNTAILDYEHHIDDSINNLTKTLEDGDPKVNLQKWFSYLSFDAICRVGFSDDTNKLMRTEEADDALLGGRRRFKHWNNWCATPFIENLLFKNRLGVKLAGTELITAIAANRVQDRLEKGGAISSHKDLLDRYFQAQEKAPELFDTRRIIALTLTIVHAGSETTGHSLTIALYCILTHPQVYARLEEEISQAKLSFPPQYSEVSKLPYLEACIKESFRVRTIATGPIERVVPPTGITILDTFIPGGTVVTLNKSALAVDSAIFDPSSRYHVNKYIPERWLGVGSTQGALMDRATFAFSHGKRGCLGIHLAWCEMLKIIPAMLMRFRIRLQDPNFALETSKGMVGLVSGPGLPVILTSRSEAQA